MLSYTFDALGRPSTETMPLGGVAGGGANLVTTTIYDLAGRTLSTSDTSGHSLTYAYDTAGRVTSNAITIPGLSGARTIAYAYDAAGNRTRVTWPDAFFVDYAYDALSRMTSASENGTVTLATYAYDRLSRRVGLTYGNGATVAYGRSWAGDLLSLVHAWGSDPNNLGGGSGVTFTHTYAPDHRLASTTASSSAFEWKPGTGGATALGTDMFNPANLLNQLTQVTLSGTAARSVTWDAAGNMTSDGVLTYVHDAENRLTNVTRTTPSLTATYTYDPLGRRVQRNVNGASTFTLHDGDEEIAEYDATGALIRRFIPGPGTDEPIAIVVPASGGGAPERRFFHEDRIGNVIAMSGVVSGGGAPALAEGPFTYDAYGRSPQPLGTPATSTPFRYTGRRLDAETGNYYYRARFYTPTLGQFIETDPVGYADSLNLYAYVGGDPVNATDPSGRAKVCVPSRDPYATRIEDCVNVDGDGNGESGDDDLTESQIAKLASDFGEFISRNDGADLSGSGKSTVSSYENSTNAAMVRATSQFVGFAIFQSGSTEQQQLWMAVPVIYAYEKQNMWWIAAWFDDLLFTPAYRATSNAIVFTGEFLNDFEGLYDSPSNIARLLLHEGLHSSSRPNLNSIAHEQLDRAAREFLKNSGLAGGGCWGGYGFPGCGG